MAPTTSSTSKSEVACPPRRLEVAPDSEPAEVSVVIPTYNRAQLCARAVRSALVQSLAPIEVIVVDDGSTDHTCERLTSEFGSSIKILTQANAGVSAARNAGLAIARGRFIALLDSDDFWSSDKLERQVDWLRKHPDYGLVLCDVRIIKLDGTDLGVMRRRERLPVDGFILNHVLRSPALIPSTAVLRREVYEKVGGFDQTLKTAEDLDFHLRISTQFKIGLVDQPLVTITQGDSEGLSNLEQTNRDHVFAVSRFIEQHRHSLNAEDARIALFNVLRYNAWSSASSGRPAEAFGFTLRAVRQSSSLADLASVASLLPLFLKVVLKNVATPLR